MGSGKRMYVVLAGTLGKLLCMVVGISDLLMTNCLDRIVLTSVCTCVLEPSQSSLSLSVSFSGRSVLSGRVDPWNLSKVPSRVQSISQSVVVWLATGTFVTENRGELRLRFLVLSIAVATPWCILYFTRTSHLPSEIEHTCAFHSEDHRCFPRRHRMLQGAAPMGRQLYFMFAAFQPHQHDPSLP